MDKPCRFCEIVAGAEDCRTLAPGIATFPAKPESVPGHVLVVPVAHVTDARDDPDLAGRVFAEALKLAAETGFDCNIATNAGPVAGQLVGHFHVHVLPRRVGGALRVPSDEVKAGRQARIDTGTEVTREFIDLGGGAGVTEIWFCEPPPLGTPFKVVRHDTSDDYGTSWIYEIEVMDPGRPYGRAEHLEFNGSRASVADMVLRFPPEEVRGGRLRRAKTRRRNRRLLRSQQQIRARLARAR